VKGVVIGGGCAGLAAAAFLAKAGHDVIVFEQHTRPGGYWSSYVRGGVVFDHGPHWTIRPERINQTLSDLGAKPISFTPLNAIGRYMLLANDGVDLVISKDRQAIESAIMQKFPTARKESIKQLFEESLRLEAELDQAPTTSPELMSWPAKVGSALKALMKMRRVLKYSRMPATAFLSELFPGPDLEGLRTMLHMIAPAEGMPALGVMVFLAFALSGKAFRPEGGTQKVSDALAQAAEANGAEIRYSHKVQRIHTQDGRVTGVELSDGSTIESSYVVSGVDAHQMYYQLLDPSLMPADFKAKLDSFPVSDTYFTASVVTDLDPATFGFDDTDVFVAPSPHLETMFTPNDPETGFFGVCFPPYRVPAARPGVHGIQILSRASFDYNNHWLTGPGFQRGEAYQALKSQYARKLLKQAERLVPGLSDHVLFLDVATPITMYRYTLNYQGAANGWSYSRVENWNKEIPFAKGLYHVGHWTGPSGIHGGLNSAYTAAQLIIRKFRKN